MNNDWEKFQEGYKNASDEVKKLIDSNQIVICVSEFCDRNSLSQDLKKKIILMYVDKLLKLVSDNDFDKYVIEVSGLSHDKISNELILINSCVANSKESIPANTTEESILSEIAETEAALKTIPPLRTMANDGKQIGYESVEENTYTSHQSAILNESKR